MFSATQAFHNVFKESDLFIHTIVIFAYNLPNIKPFAGLRKEYTDVGTSPPFVGIGFIHCSYFFGGVRSQCPATKDLPNDCGRRADGTGNELRRPGAEYKLLWA